MWPFPPYIRWTGEVISWAALWRWWLAIAMALRSRNDRRRLLGIVGRGVGVRFPLAIVQSVFALAVAFIPWVALVAVLRAAGY
jgi:hypothetical protein